MHQSIQDLHRALLRSKAQAEAIAENVPNFKVVARNIGTNADLVENWLRNLPPAPAKQPAPR